MSFTISDISQNKFIIKNKIGLCSKFMIQSESDKCIIMDPITCIDNCLNNFYSTRIKNGKAYKILSKKQVYSTF